MKYLATSLIMLVATVTWSADTNIVAVTQYADGSTNVWTQGDLQDSLGLLNRKYWRDMESETGRRAWHGSPMGQYLLTNETTKVIYVATLYSDGYVHTAAGRMVRSADPEARAKAAAAAQARSESIKAAWEAAHLPPELAAIRAAQRAAAQTNEVTIIHSN